MPKVVLPDASEKHFPYTPAGERAASKFAKNTGGKVQAAMSPESEKRKASAKARSAQRKHEALRKAGGVVPASKEHPTGERDVSEEVEPGTRRKPRGTQFVSIVIDTPRKAGAKKKDRVRSIAERRARPKVVEPEDEG